MASFDRIGPNQYRLQPTPNMQVEAIFYASKALLPQLLKDSSLDQLCDTAKLPHLSGPVLGMPDMHQGYGIPVGGIMASRKIVSAGCVGMDINCGVRLLTTDLDHSSKHAGPDRLRRLMDAILEHIPIGPGGAHSSTQKDIDFDQVLTSGAKHLIDRGFGVPEDITFCEDGGCLPQASPQKLSPRALSRARRQLGTLGSGNHFIELQRVEHIFDASTAAAFNLFPDRLCLMLHSGSRALGHQTCIDYTQAFFQTNQTQHPQLVPGKDLASAYIDSPLGQDYLSAQNACINFAYSNRQLMTHYIRRAFSRVYGRPSSSKPCLDLVYDVAHNSAKWERHLGQKLLVHRKGATRALPPLHPLLPGKYRPFGQPAIIPGSMGTPSYVVVATPKAAATYFSVNHGAGRTLGRRQARRSISRTDFDRQTKGIIINQPYHVVADEAPAAYKDIDEVVDTLASIGLTRPIARLSPLMVIKGN